MTTIPATLTPTKGTPVVNGTLVVAQLDCAQLGLADVMLGIHSETMQLTFLAPCGCNVSIRLTPLILDLAEMQADGHSATSCTTH